MGKMPMVRLLAGRQLNWKNPQNCPKAAASPSVLFAEVLTAREVWCPILLIPNGLSGHSWSTSADCCGTRSGSSDVTGRQMSFRKHF